jgi:hypothetical protein
MSWARWLCDSGRGKSPPGTSRCWLLPCLKLKQLLQLLRRWDQLLGHIGKARNW